MIITGPIGAGKSSVCRKIMEKEDYGYIPEYIEEEGGEDMLGRYKEKKISDSVFQRYILDHFERKLMEIKRERVLIERSPEEGAVIFFVRTRENEEDYERLVERAHNIQDRYMINAKSRGSRVVQIDTSKKSIEEVASLILDYIKANKRDEKEGFIFYLKADKRVCLQRIKNRGRSAEKDLSEDFLEILMKKYEDYLQPSIFLY